MFSGVDKNNCTLYVPQGTKDVYQTTPQWSDFVNIVEVLVIPGDVNDDGRVTAADVTALYYLLLNNDTTNLVNGDLNGDGFVTSADVTAINDILLGN